MLLLYIPKRIFDTDEYHRMAEAGILKQDEHVELINGEIIDMAPIGTYHASCVDRLNRLFSKRLPETVIIRVQNPVHIEKYSEPQPDIAILKMQPDFYADRHPCPDDVLLIAEVADTSLEYEHKVKLPLYAKAGIAEVWIVNLKEECVEVHSKQSGERYEKSGKFKKDKILISETFSDIKIAVNEIIGKNP